MKHSELYNISAYIALILIAFICFICFCFYIVIISINMFIWIIYDRIVYNYIDIRHREEKFVWY